MAIIFIPFDGPRSTQGSSVPIQGPKAARRRSLRPGQDQEEAHRVSRYREAQGTRRICRKREDPGSQDGQQYVIFLPPSHSSCQRADSFVSWLIRNVAPHTSLTSQIGSLAHRGPGRLQSRRLWLEHSVAPLNAFHSEESATRQRSEGTAALMSPVALVRSFKLSRKPAGRILSFSCRVYPPRPY